jgi:hypothetical protein
MMKKVKNVVLVGGFALLVSGCNVDLNKVEVPTELSKEVKVEQIQLDPSLEDVNKVKSDLSKKVIIPEDRETSALKDPFVPKSLKGLKMASLKSREVKNEENIVSDNNMNEKNSNKETKNEEKLNNSISLQEESPMMFNFEGISVSTNSKLAILRHLVDGKTYIVRIGDVVGGYKVVDITDDSLVLLKGSEKLVITKKNKKVSEK